MSIKQKILAHINFRKLISFTICENIFLYMCLGLFVIEILLLGISSLNSAPFTPDTWAYFDISKQLFSNFYKISYIRQFEYISDYSISFPPLYPFFIALFNTIWPVGIYAGYIINFLFLIPLGYVFIKLNILLTSYKLPAIYILILLFTHAGFISELIGARSMIISLLLLLILIYFFIEEKITVRRAIIIASLAGLLTLNRFDFLLPALLLGPLMYFNSSGNKLKLICCYFATFIVVISPWITYSLVYFDTFFITDNRRTFLLATKNFTLDYYSDTNRLTTIFTNFPLWIVYRVVFKGILSFVAFIENIWSYVLFQQLAFTTFVLYVAKAIVDKHGHKKSFPIKNLELLKNLLLLSPIFFLQLFSISMTGFLDMRYSLFMVVYLSLVLTTLLFLVLNILMSRKSVNIFITIITFFIMSTTIIFPLRNSILDLKNNSLTFNKENLFANDSYNKIARIIKSNPKPSVFLVHTTETTDLVSGQFAALTDVKTIETPSNLNAFLLLELVKRYKINYIYTSCSSWLSTLNAHYILNETDVRNLYFIDGKKLLLNQELPIYSVEPDDQFTSCQET